MSVSPIFEKGGNNRDHYGEVFTPPILINEILDNLPHHVWRDPTLTWFDPCAGQGNFFLPVVERLMSGLTTSFPNPNLRKRHILSKMLYMNELNPENVKVVKNVFGISAINITALDFLSPDVFLPTQRKYNIILENPPYQIPKTDTYKGARGSNNTLWDKFIAKSFDLLEAGGWLGAITPANWRRPGHSLYSPIIAPHLEYLHIYSKKEGIRLFNAQTRFDLYILSNSQRHSLPPVIIDEMGKTHRNIRPAEWAFLPSYNFKGVQKYFAVKTRRLLPEGRGRERGRVLYDSNEYNSKYLSKRKTAKYKYPVVHTITKKGLGVRWTDNKKGHYGIPKVLLNFNENQYPYNDWKGEYGMSQITFGIPVASKKGGEDLVKEFETPEFKEVIRATKWGSFQTDYKMFEYLK